MRHLCENCRDINISDEVIASIRNRLSNRDVVHVLREPHVPGVEYLRRSSVNGTPSKKPCHLCDLILRSLKNTHNIGTAEEDSGLPEGPISLDVSIRGDEIMLIARTGDILGNPLTVSVGSDESCRGAQVSTDSDSEEIFTKILAWCSDCSDRHDQCSRNNKETWLSSRVIDVGPPGGQPRLRLRDTRGCTGRYITLTHRWTSLTEASGTTNSNIGWRKVSIHTEELSKTFQDAVQVTRKLGIQYLWIDALCIVQDNQKDWRMEAKNMASIYELAWLNIASAGSETLEGRLFMKRDSRLSRPCRLPATFSRLTDIQPNCIGEDVYVYLGSEFYAQSVFEGFLSRRGWILQERLLSPRTVYFSKDEIYWECNYMIASESVPWGWENQNPLIKINSQFRQLKGNHAKVREDPILEVSADKAPLDLGTDTKRLSVVIQPTVLASMYEYWYRIVEIYSNKKFTVDMDTLPAIHGIAQALYKSRIAHQVFEECYYYGIWTADLTRELLWIGEPKEPSSDYIVTNTIRLFTDRMPTYTWASCGTPVKFLLAQFAKVSHVDNIRLLPEEQVIRSEWMDRVGSEYLTLPNFTTKTPRGSLQVDGQLEDGTLHMDAPELINQSDLITGLLTFQGHESLTPHTILDASFMVDGTLSWLEISYGRVWCLGIATTNEATVSKAVQWPISSTNSSASASSGECTLGLILIPTAEYLQSLHNSKPKLGEAEQWPGMWDDWYLTKTPLSFRRIGVYKSREHPPPNASITTIVLA